MPSSALLHCPRCQEKMATTSCNGIDTHACLYCNGVWINGNSLDILLNKENNPPAKSALLTAFKTQSDNKANRYCPGCEHEKLYQITSHGVELDLCQKCNGLFFDEGEIKQVLPNMHQALVKAALRPANVIESFIYIIVTLFTL